MERRLAAILVADVVGYSRLMGADESGTLRRLTELRQEILEPLIAEHNRHTVKLMGDGVHMAFGSVVDGVTLAVEAQCAMRDLESSVKTALPWSTASSSSPTPIPSFGLQS